MPVLANCLVLPRSILKKCCCIFYFSAMITICLSQDMAGYMGSNYAGVNSLWINPSGFFESKYLVDYNISGLQIFFENNCFYLPKEDYRFSRFLESNPEFPEYVGFNPYDEKRFYKDYYNTDDKSGFVNIRYWGPSVAIRHKKNSFGIYTDLRFILDADHIPYHVMKFYIEGVDYYPMHNIRFDASPYRAGMNAYLEAAFNYSRILFYNGESKFSGGLNIKILSSYAAAYARSNICEYFIPNDNLLTVYNLSGDYGYSMPFDRYEYKYTDAGLFSRGVGGGIDLGFTFVSYDRKYFYGGSTLASEDNGKDYRYKLNLSLIDFGFLKIAEDAHVFTFNNDTCNWFDIDKFKARSFIHIDTTASIEFRGGPNASQGPKEFTMLLPFSVYFQADFNPLNHLYINTSFFYGLKSRMPSVRHPAVFTLAPRFESRYFGLWVPVTYYDLSKLHLGFGIRLFDYFYAGSDNVKGFRNNTDFTGMDLYFGIKYSYRGPKNPNKRKGSIFKPNKCYKFR